MHGETNVHAVSVVRTGTGMGAMTDRVRAHAARLAALALAAVLATGFANATAASERWFIVEIIVFDDLEAEGLHAELWPADPGEPSVEDAVELAASAQEERAFGLARSSELRLRDAWGALRRSSRYRPLMHVGWRLPGLGHDAARPAHIAPYLGQEREGIVVRGTVKVSLARYLHLELDLLYDRPRDDTATSADESAPTLFRLRSKRRMRSTELHYIDHPMFGVLVLITPVTT